MTPNSQIMSGLQLVRHGESIANEIQKKAEREGSARYELPCEDHLISLSLQGILQAIALGEYLASLSPEERPQVIYASDYTRAIETRDIVIAVGWRNYPDELSKLKDKILIDSRLGERKWGEFAGATRIERAAIIALKPEEYRNQSRYCQRPEGGESLEDVEVNRIEPWLKMANERHAGERVMVFSHSLTKQVFRKALEHLTPDQLMAIDDETGPPNCSVTSYQADLAAGELMLHGQPYFVAPAHDLHVVPNAVLNWVSDLKSQIRHAG